MGQLLSRNQRESMGSSVAAFEIRSDSSLHSFERVHVPWRSYAPVDPEHAILHSYLLLRKVNHLLVNDIVVEAINISSVAYDYDWMVPAVQSGIYFSTIVVEHLNRLNESYLTAFHSKEFYISSKTWHELCLSFSIFTHAHSWMHLTLLFATWTRPANVSCDPSSSMGLFFPTSGLFQLRHPCSAPRILFYTVA